MSFQQQEVPTKDKFLQGKTSDPHEFYPANLEFKCMSSHFRHKITQDLTFVSPFEKSTYGYGFCGHKIMQIPLSI